MTVPPRDRIQLAHTPVVWGGDTRGRHLVRVNAYGLVIGLTNDAYTGEDQENDPQRRSRGLLCLVALQCRTAARGG
jgi:hypothetical protein